MEINNEKQAQIVRDLLQLHPLSLLCTSEPEDYWVCLAVNIYSALQLTDDKFAIAQDIGSYSFIASRHKLSLINMTLGRSTWVSYTRPLTTDLDDNELFAEILNAIAICWLRLEYYPAGIY